MNDTIQTKSPSSLSPDQLAELQLLDVRTPGEFRSVHAQFARLIPLDRLDAQTFFAESGFSPDKPIHILCQSGRRAQSAAEKLHAGGVKNCIVIEGGTNAWVDAGLPVERGQNGVISIERQVRITAGAIVLAGVVLGFFVNPGFFLLSGFVGCGLIFAGITDWCGMALLLGKMPWNK
ncbi:rhodanese-like domain-containing protein [Kamptonema cortianum]|nr:rhodanese-like domain-containing protein [Oscillatoria laete-virens]MDK3157885.1 rhodanese-like domain-containing protein [Kamptonema cortianum]MDL5046015.1 rhodanese-like domain-containing protein [Oscillatoria amoena NRMC-F 0135]MDL5052721.1 rhodanese-like domain-containing protein [Oscillatoria laete-virens NRMC-F 0139]